MYGRPKIYGHPISMSSDIVLLTVAEGGLEDYDYAVVDLAQQANKRPEFLAMNPSGKIPVLTTAEGDHISESRAIAQYLAARYGFTHLVPKPDDLLGLARFYQAASSETFNFNVPAEELLHEVFVLPLFMGRPVNEKVVTRTRSLVEKHLDVCEQAFKAGQKYMAGDSFSLVDIFYIPIIARMIDAGHGDLFTKREMVNDWWQRCLARPATGKFVQTMPKIADLKA
ncbi:predicted protein [Uncinocarpus reesii 1704]|uniref:glutathione transferase n=1 Tax=Uncinocarpus reesii (strain UAMH 1704) TaxID=336963 RepID=C4JHG6_UNCRE|nr:uncharacterized protein UREG_01329 [Uncinocarpus reesii 1704]EEP76480.1 predicted protein [Uncinocarpus reesii 1704]